MKKTATKNVNSIKCKQTNGNVY